MSRPSRCLATLFLLSFSLLAQSQSTEHHRPPNKKPDLTGLNFANPTLYSSGGVYSLSVAAADVNGDGKLDLVVANDCVSSSDCNGSVAVLLGNGDGTFQSAQTYGSGGYGAVSVAVGDVNTDGKLDLVVVNECESSSQCQSPGVVGVLLGNGDGTFQPALIYGTGMLAPGLHASVAISDLNGDGKFDLVIANQWQSSSDHDGDLAVLLGNGDGTFQTAVTYYAGGLYTRGVAIGDVNGDGGPDLLAANFATSTVGVLLNAGDGTFQTAATYPVGGECWNVATGDFNGDGKVDLACAEQGQNLVAMVGVLLNNGDGTFQTVVNYGAGGTEAQAVAVADINGDGNLDLIVANTISNNIGVLLGKGDGTFPAGAAFNTNAYQPQSVAVGDFNGDGKPDLAAANYCLTSSNCTGAVSVFLNTSISPTSISLASSPDPSTFGQTVTFTATVSSEGFKGIPTGTVIFYDGNIEVQIGTAILSDTGVATLTTSTLAVGDHIVFAIYGGDPNFESSASSNLDQTVQGAVIQISATTLSFSNQTVGTSSTPQNVFIQNTGNISLSITSIAFAGTNSTDFSETDNCGTSVGPGGSCTIYVSFTPTGVGGRNASLLISDNAPRSPQSVVLGGTGVQATTNTALISSLNPSAFGQSVTLTATVSTQSSVNPTGVVSFLDGTTTIGSANLSSSKTAAVTTSTLSVGSHSITASYSGDLNFIGSTSSVLNQVVQGAVVYLSTIKINFGNQTVGVSSTSQSVMLTNNGNIALTISSIGIAGMNTADFSQTNNCGSSVAAGTNCTISVWFTPTATGPRSANVTIRTNAAKGTATISLSGTGVQPSILLSPASLIFPTQVVFTNSKSQTVTLTNSGLGILKITKIASNGSFNQTNTCGSSVAAGSSCIFTVTFRPTAIGTLTGSIAITDNALLSPQKITLNGTGTYIQLAPTSLNFGNQPVGTKSLPKKITLSNKGSVAVSISDISVVGTNSSDFAETNTCGSSLAAGASCFITVTFTPSAKGPRSASMAVSDNGGGSPQKVTLQGTGT